MSPNFQNLGKLWPLAEKSGDHRPVAATFHVSMPHFTEFDSLGSSEHDQHDP